MNFDPNMKPQVLSEDQLGSQGPGYVYDVEGGDVSLPDTEQLLDSVIEIMECMDTSEMKQLKDTDEAEYKLEMEKRFPQFSFRYYSIFQKVISGDDITPLMGMLAQIEKVKRGELTIDEAEKYVGESLAKKYVYPKLNKKK